MKNQKYLVQAILSFFLIAFALPILAQQSISFMRPYDKKGVNIFETPKSDTIPFSGVKVKIGGNFTQQFQTLDHKNKGMDIDGDGQIDNALFKLNSGFNLATANLNIDAQLYDGVRLNLVTFLSSRHHAEAWVKGGYLQFDKLKFLNSAFFDDLMNNVTIKIGHMEVNYGDSHFRRTDNGNALYNPFVGNYIMDAFNTEIGGEVYFRTKDITGMLGITGGELNGNIGEALTGETDDKAKRSPSYIGKLAYDTQVNDDFRFRLSGSVYHTASSHVNHLYDGDRAGSRYYLVMEAPDARAGSNFRSGRYSPDFSDKVTSFMGNVFIKFKGLEFFGTYENAEGRNWFESETRNANQVAADLIYRMGKNENLYFGGRYNVVHADDPSGQEVSIGRFQLGAGWFLTDNILLKGEYVKQTYKDFPNTSLLYEGEFDGVMIEAVIGF